MIRILLFLSILAFVGSSCRKSNDHSSIVPAPEDSLLGWKVISTIPNKNLQDIWFNSAQKGFLLGDRLYQTSNGGQNWQVTPNTNAIKNFDHLFFLDAKNGFTYDSSHLATTVDGGLTWTIKSLPTDSALTMFFVDAATGFYSDRSGGSLKKTTDSGNTWKNIAKNATAPDIYYPFFFDADTGYIATGQGIFASTTSGGVPWNSILQPFIYSGMGLHYNAYNQLLFLDSKKGFYAYPDGVIETVDAGQTWSYSLNGTYDPFCFNNIIRFPDPNTGYYKAYTVIYKTSDGGGTWNFNCRVGEDYFTGVSFIDGHTGWACTHEGRILKLQD